MTQRRIKLQQACVANYTAREEIANALTHGLAAILSVVGLVVLICFAVVYSGSAKVITAVSIFGASMILLYSASTLYHAVTHKKAKRILQILDHSMIYILIAGSYTPFCLITLDGHNGLLLCAIVWSIAVIGVVFQKHLLKKSDWLNCVLYLTMGWMVVFFLEPLVQQLNQVGLWLLVAGGVTYSLGVIFYVWERLPYNHAIWHVFVLLGTVMQFFSVLLYVIPGVSV